MPMAEPPIEEQQPRPTDGRSLPPEYSAGEIAVRVQAAPGEIGQRAEAQRGYSSTPLGVPYGNLVSSGRDGKQRYTGKNQDFRNTACP